MVKSFDDHILSLDISHNSITSGLVNIVTLFDSLQSIQEIDLSGNTLEGCSEDDLVKLVLAPSLIILRLSNCPLATALPTKLNALQSSQSRSLEELYIRDNPFGNEGLHQLLVAIHKLGFALNTLDLSNTGMTWIPDGDEDPLARAIGEVINTGRLSSLCLANCQLSSPDLLKSILSADVLQRLDLSSTNISTVPVLFDCFAEAICLGKISDELILSGNSLNPQQYKKLYDAVVATQLKKIELNKCSLGVDGILDFFMKTESSVFLEEISFRGNVLRRVGANKNINRIGKLKSQNLSNFVSLTLLDLSDNDWNPVEKEFLKKTWKSIHNESSIIHDIGSELRLSVKIT